MVPKGIEALLDPNTLPGIPQQPTQPVATFAEAAPPAPAPQVEAPPAMPRIKPRPAPAPAPASGIPALAQLRAQLTELETQLQQNPMAQLANQVAALTVQLDRIEAALGSVSKLAVALTTRLDEVGLAVGRIEESQERAAKAVATPAEPPPAAFLAPTQPGTLQDLAAAHWEACKLDWGGPVTWEVSVIGGTVFQCRTLEDALNEVQLRSFVSTLRAVRKTEGGPEETRRIYIASRPLDQVLAEIHKLHADPQWQPQTREGLAANAAEIGGSSAYQKVKDLACPLCGAGPGIRCWKLNRKGLTTTVNCESPHRERREAPMDRTGGVNDGN